MSGGSFNYAYARTQEFADALAYRIDENEKEDQYGDAPRLSPEVLRELQQLVSDARELAVKMRAAEWLYSHDIGPDALLKRIAEAGR